MDFFAQQDAARRNTRLLVVLFLIAVALLILLTNAVVTVFFYFNEFTPPDLAANSHDMARNFFSFFSLERFGWISLGMSATVALVVFFKWMQLATGGKAVAESMGAVRILPQSRDRDEVRCLNVVEEMALAANMPVPPVYILNDERGINAFAAGISPADAIVAVTRGTILQLKRHELQGVIAHEFSHILNGDMRLNIRLAAMLKGITFIGDIGHFMLRHSTRVRTGLGARSNENLPVLPIMGLVLCILGWLGSMTAGFIKAAISRQKEYLADASAVQYTRSNEGISDALKVIGGYIPGTLVHAARAAEMSHIFFGRIEHSLWQVFSTHPPLPERIRRVDPAWDGQYIERETRHYQTKPTRPGQGEVGVGRAAVVTAAIASALADNISKDTDEQFGPSPEELEQERADQQEIPLVFVQHSHEPLGAQALIFALLLGKSAGEVSAQLEIIRQTNVRGLPELVNTLAPGVKDLGAPRRLPLLEMCLPALKAMSAPQYRMFKNAMLSVIRADQRTELYEWCLFQLVRHYLDPEFVQVKPYRARYRRLQKVVYHLRIVLSVLAHEGESDTEAVFRQAADELGFTDMAILPREQASVAAFSQAVYELAHCYPLLQPRILKAMVLAASVNGELCPVEREIIASIAAFMDCPAPSPADL